MSDYAGTGITIFKKFSIKILNVFIGISLIVNCVKNNKI